MIMNSISSEAKDTERRRARRFPIDLPVQLLTVEDSYAAPIQGTVINISLRGACVSSQNARRLREAKASKVVLKLGNISAIRGGALQVSVRIRWNTLSVHGATHKHGIEFIEVTRELEVLIARIISSLSHKDKDGALEDSEKGTAILPRHGERIPHDSRKDYSEEFIESRRKWLDEVTETRYEHIGNYSINPEQVKGNIENFVGVAQIPVGVFGPLKIKGDYAKGTFYVPLATTEGGITVTYQRGAVAITRAGGVNAYVQADENHLDPVFHCATLKDAVDLSNWVGANSERFKEIVQHMSQHAVLTRITPHIVGRRIILDFAYSTQDAMGANLINVATEACCELIASEIGNRDYFLRSNFSSEKKSSGSQLVASCGRSVTAEAILPRRIVERYLSTTPVMMSEGWRTWALSSVNAGMIGFNAQFANGLAAMYIACGQDVAHITNGSVGMTMFELTAEGDLYAAVKLPNLIVGTVGGGTALPTQSECLKMLGCYGKGKARKFAEIVAASLLAGEIAICAGITTGHFQDPHKRARFFTRLKAFDQE